MKNLAWLAFAFTALFAASEAFSQNTVRVRGTVEKVDGSLLSVKERNGSNLTIKLTDGAKAQGIKKASLADIKPGTYVGAAAVPMPDGNLKALEVLVFPEEMRGRGEGHRGYDLQPNSTMTNATVVDAQVGPEGKTLSLKYKDGEKKIIVTEQTPVVIYVPATLAELKPGAKIIIYSGTRLPDGTIEAARVGVGLDGLTPPM